MLCWHLRLAAQTIIKACVEVFIWRGHYSLEYILTGKKLSPLKVSPKSSLQSFFCSCWIELLAKKSTTWSGIQDWWAPHQAQPLQVFQQSSPSSLATTSPNWIIGSDESFRLDSGEVWGPLQSKTDPIWPFTVKEVLLGCFDSGYSESYTMSIPMFVLMKIQAGLFCGCLVSFLLSWLWRWVFFCVSVSPVVSCLRLARIGEPPQAPSPSTPTTSSYALLSCPVQACIIYPPACLLAYASWSAP